MAEGTKSLFEVKWPGLDDHTIVIHHAPPSINVPRFYNCPENPKMYQFKRKEIPWNTSTRKLVSQSAVHFMRLQEEAKQQSSEGTFLSVESLVHYSHLYRSTLHECVLGLRDMARTSEPSEEECSASEQASLHQMLELAWHLCEILFVEVLPAGCLIQQLLEWTRWHGRSEEEELRELLATPNPEAHEKYWKTVYRLVLKGQLMEASDLLLHHSHAHTNPKVFSSMKELLHKAPMLKSTVGKSRSELHRHWSEWKKMGSQKKASGVFLTLPQLHLLAKVVCGDEDAFEETEIISCCDYWYELMVGKLLFVSPLVVSTDYDLFHTAEWSQKTMEEFKDNPENEEERAVLDKLLHASLRTDLMEVIQISSSEIGNWWFVAHLSNLLQHKGLLTASRVEPLKLFEFLVLEYSLSLMTHPSLWGVTMDYLEHCPSHGKHFMQLIVERIPLTSEKKANKILHVCKRYQLKEQARDICKVLAMRAYKNGRLGVALSWCIRGKNSVFAAFLAEKYMENFESLGEFMDLDLLDHLGDAMLMNEKLMFLAKYREYHKLYEKKEFVKSGELLMSLLTSDSVPRRFLSTLLKDALGLLDKGDVLVFSSKQTYALSHFVLELSMLPTLPSTEISPDRLALLKKVEEEQVSLLQLALVNNLCRAIMQEGN